MSIFGRSKETNQTDTRPSRLTKYVVAISMAGVALSACSTSPQGENDVVQLGQLVAEAPAEPGAETTTPESPEVDQRIVEMADIAKAEQISGISLEEFKQFASDSENSPYLQYLRANYPGKYSAKTADPELIGFDIIAAADEGSPESYKTLNDYLSASGFNANNIGSIVSENYDWYANNMGLIKSMSQNPNLSPNDMRLFENAQHALVACALLAKYIHQGGIIDIPGNSSGTADPRVKEILDYAQGSKTYYDKYIQENRFFVLKTKPDGSLDFDSPYDREAYTSDMITFGQKTPTIGPWKSTDITRLKNNETTEATSFFGITF